MTEYPVWPDPAPDDQIEGILREGASCCLGSRHDIVLETARARYQD